MVRALFLTAFAVMARIRTVFANQGYDAGRRRALCCAFGATPASTSAAIRLDRAWAGRWLVERSPARILEIGRLALCYDRLRVVIQPLLQAACTVMAAERHVREAWKPPAELESHLRVILDPFGASISAVGVPTPI